MPGLVLGIHILGIDRKNGAVFLFRAGEIIGLERTGCGISVQLNRIVVILRGKWNRGE